MKKFTAALTGSLVLAVVLTGCIPIAGTSAPREKAGSSSEQSPQPSFAEAAEEPEAEDTNAAFGEAVTYADDVAISVSAPTPFAPTQYAAGADQANNVAFTLTVTNNSKENLQPSIYSRVSSGGAEASSIFDYENPVGDLTGAPSTVILPGQTITWIEAYSLADPATITFQVAPNYEYADAIFTNIAG